MRNVILEELRSIFGVEALERDKGVMGGSCEGSGKQGAATGIPSLAFGGRGILPMLKGILNPGVSNPTLRTQIVWEL